MNLRNSTSRKLVAILAICSLQACSAPDPVPIAEQPAVKLDLPKDFLGIEVDKPIKLHPCDVIDENTTYPCWLGGALVALDPKKIPEGVRNVAELRMLDDSVHSILVVVEPLSTETVRAKLVEKYGPVHESSSHTSIWKGKHVYVDFTEKPDFSSSYISVSSRRKLPSESPEENKNSF